MNPLIIGPFKQALCFSQTSNFGALTEADLDLRENISISVDSSSGVILELGSLEDLKAQFSKAPVEHIEEEHVLLPGFIDAHTHICFAGSRARDFNSRLEGKSYQQIAKEGGGIQDTVGQCRKASQEELASLCAERANRHLAQGITSIEVKSGYGLTPQEELKILRAISKAQKRTPADLIATCLAAHMKPFDFKGSHAEYLEEIQNELWPQIKKEKLSNRQDIFVEENAFSVEQAEPYLEAALKEGFQITIHADQFTTGGSLLGCRLKAQSVDHLEHSTQKEIDAIAKAKIAAVALPGASLGLGETFSPARKLLDAGACLAVASDWNPGSAPMGQLLTQLAILATAQKMTSAEALASIGHRAAFALGLKDRGRLQKQMRADLVAFATADYREILYQQGSLSPSKVWKGANRCL